MAKIRRETGGGAKRRRMMRRALEDAELAYVVAMANGRGEHEAAAFGTPGQCDGGGMAVYETRAEGLMPC